MGVIVFINNTIIDICQCNNEQAYDSGSSFHD
jgi:hypothetical protein